MSERKVPLAAPSAAWTSGAATDTGLVRGRNEDRYWIDDERGVFLVVDGVGGHAAGELAAETAVETIRESLFTGEFDAEERVRRAITLANNRIFELAQETGEHQGMACVLTLALVEGGNITIGHVGDSRLYLIWKSAIRKLTSDHSPVGEGEDSGELTEEEAMLHPRRNEVFRDVGSRPRDLDRTGFVEIRKCRFRPDAAILLCSDGLTDRLTSAHVREIAEHYDGDASKVAAQLVDAANRAGGQDNVTAIFVAGPDFRTRRGATRPRTDAAPGRSTAPIAPMQSEEPVQLPRPRSRFLTGRAAFLTYGILIGMLLWAVLRVITKGVMR
ncbi:MAG TPA: protein phosphatase 2C domain-containing protein [Bryobacteraceae bacterium]|nr:protein phosphatase 2C domain-containing protein [Bryobacteraceae bacterium]